MDKQKNQPIEVDIVVVGAGIIGLATAASAAKLGMRVCCIDQQLPPEKDGAIYGQEQLQSAWVSALASPAVTLLDEIGVWDDLRDHACPYHHMHVEICGAPIHLSHRDAMTPNLGHILNNFRIKQALWQSCRASDGVVFLQDTPQEWRHEEQQLYTTSGQQITAALCVGADGVNSWCRSAAGISHIQHEYIQDNALVGMLQHGKPHHQTARQYFSEHGVLGILPSTDYHRSIYVWSSARGQSQADSLATMLQRVPSEIGSLKPIGEPRSHRIVSQRVTKYHNRQIVLAGDAAVSVHPLAGQGMNIGLRHVIMLMKQLKYAHRNSQLFSNQQILSRYQELCCGFDALSCETYSHMRRWLCHRSGVWSHFVGLGVRCFNQAATVKRVLIQHALHANMH
jgi:2-octaprenylphenol hydroxylase